MDVRGEGAVRKSGYGSKTGASRDPKVLSSLDLASPPPFLPFFLGVWFTYLYIYIVRLKVYLAFGLLFCINIIVRLTV